MDGAHRSDWSPAAMDMSLIPKRVLVASGKGGSGKTTTTRNLAVAAVYAGMKVSTIDLDESPTLSRWWTKRATRDIDHMTSPITDVKGDFYKELMGVRGSHIMFIDSPPALSAYPAVASSVLRAVDLVVVPTQQYTEDIEAVTDWVTLLRQQKRLTMLLLNNTHRRESSFEIAKRRLVSSGSSKVSLCPIDIPHAADIPKTTARGLGVLDINGAKGGPDYEAVFSHIRHILGL